MNPELELRSIVKRYGAVVANADVSLAVAPAEIRAIVGENGAGKSTLMGILYGDIQPDEGKIFIRGKPVHFRSPLDAIRAGLGMVHQSFMLFPSLSVTDNVIFGHEPTRYGLIDRERAAEQVAAVAKRYALQVDPRARVGDLPVGVRQRVEILKALHRGAEILILDEPTAVLTPQEVDALFVTLRELRSQGKTILFITHKLREVMELADTATVLRDGRVITTVRVADTSPAELARAMTGRDVLPRIKTAPQRPGERLLAVNHVTVRDQERRAVVKDVSFSVHAGEIVGIAGVAGNGQTELIEALVGLRPVDSGHVMIQGQDVTHDSVAAHRAAGLAYVPEDRHHVGTAPAASIADNLAVGFEKRTQISTRGLLRPGGLRDYAQQLIERFSIKVGSPRDRAASLSGGNLQKIVLARELTHEAPCLIAEQPTRGLDIGAIEYVHQQLIAYREAGHAVLLVSAELTEIMTLSDRILVMLEGRIVGELPRDAASETELGLMMAGAHEAREAIG